jgi:YD repeat-containing protein
VLAQIDQLGHATSYSYDALNRQVTQTDADNYTTTYAYDAAGEQISLTDADNNVTSRRPLRLGHGVTSAWTSLAA